MHLPFFKKQPKPSQPGAVDVTAKSVTTGVVAAVPTTITTRVAPDLGDYSTEYPEPLPASWNFIPWCFWACILATAGYYAFSFQTQANVDRRLKEVSRAQGQASVEKGDLSAKAAAIGMKMDDLRAVSFWVNASSPIRELLVSTASAANTRVQIKALEISRREGLQSKYSLVVTCNGTTGTFTKMREDLNKRLLDAGWTVAENTPDPNDLRMVYDAQVSKTMKSNTN